MPYADEIAVMRDIVDGAINRINSAKLTDEDSIRGLNEHIERAYSDLASAIADTHTKPRRLEIFRDWLALELIRKSGESGVELEDHRVMLGNEVVMHGYLFSAKFKERKREQEARPDTVVISTKFHSRHETKSVREVDQAVYSGYTADAKRLLQENYAILNEAFKKAYGKDFVIPGLKFENSASDFYRTHLETESSGTSTIVLRADAYNSWEEGNLNKIISHELGHAMFESMLQEFGKINWQGTDNFVHEKRFEIDEAVALAAEQYVKLAKKGVADGKETIIAAALLNNVCYNCSLQIYETERYHQEIIDKLSEKDHDNSVITNLDEIFDKLDIWHSVKGESYFKYDTSALQMAKFITDNKGKDLFTLIRGLSKDLVESERNLRLVGSAEQFADYFGVKLSLKGNKYYDQHEDGRYVSNLNRLRVGMLAILHGQRITVRDLENRIDEDHRMGELMNWLLHDAEGLLKNVTGLDTVNGNTVKSWVESTIESSKKGKP